MRRRGTRIWHGFELRLAFDMVTHNLQRHDGELTETERTHRLYVDIMESRMSVDFQTSALWKIRRCVECGRRRDANGEGILGWRYAERRNRCHLVDRCQRRERPVLHLASEHKPRRPENGMGSREYSGGNGSADDFAAPARLRSDWRRSALSRRGGADAGKVARCGVGSRQKLACGHPASVGRLTRSREEAGARMTFSRLFAQRK